jgi:cysteinyl-tRNA synthetase
MRAYIFADILRRVLELRGYSVNQIVNITDVGHLTSDADEGEDKIEKGASREGKSAAEIINFYTEVFLKDITSLHIKVADEFPTHFPKATEHIEEQIALIQVLDQKGFVYQTSDGVYFDTSKFPNYGKLGNIDIAGLESGARVEENLEKRNITDFALWKF